MANLIKALVLFTFGFTILANLGDALEKTSTPRVGSSIAASVTPGSSQPPGYVIKEDHPQYAEKPLPEPSPVVRNGTYAQVCSSFDPIAHPEQVIDILEYASQVTGTPVDVLYAIWRNETGHVDGAGVASGTCDVMNQLQLRCTYGGSCKHKEAMELMATRFNWNLKGMTCSCGTASWGNDTHYYGGCCGPFQFSGAEIVDNATANGLDPMTFCGGAILAGWELKDHHDKYVRQGSDDVMGWRRAISRYFGSDSQGKYWSKAYAQWRQFHDWYSQGPEVLREKVTGKSVYSAAYHRKLRISNVTFASNP